MSETLQSIAKKMVADHKGLLAADESNPTAKKRLDSINLEATEENRRRYRELFFSTAGIEDYISGVILFDETTKQKDSQGVPFVELLINKGIIPGIKVDKGAKDLANFEGEKVTEGLDGLRDSLKEYYEMGIRFAKWRSVITIGENIPSDFCYLANAHGLARYAALCQEAGIVPVVEPEVLLNGDHDIVRSEEVTTKITQIMFEQLKQHKVQLDGLILKSSMVISGDECKDQATADEIAEATLRCFKKSVPAEVPGIVFLSGGQTDTQATENLNAVNKMKPSPWTISFSYARALQASPLKVWAGKEENIPAAQEAFMKRLKVSKAANQGKYSSDME
ncbi:MAG: class I fructose-bisphosphate aldolase [bacterium]|nr:class I fructose-bisphosphate aldolase [bacterium]